MHVALLKITLRTLLTVWGFMLIGIFAVRPLGASHPPSTMLAWVSTRDGNAEIDVLVMTTKVLLNASSNTGRRRSPGRSTDRHFEWSSVRENTSEIYLRGEINVCDSETSAVNNVTTQPASGYSPECESQG